MTACLLAACTRAFSVAQSTRPLASDLSRWAAFSHGRWRCVVQGAFGVPRRPTTVLRVVSVLLTFGGSMLCQMSGKEGGESAMVVRRQRALMAKAQEWKRLDAQRRQGQEQERQQRQQRQQQRSDGPSRQSTDG